jgi:hypothetical protein
MSLADEPKAREVELINSAIEEAKNEILKALSDRDPRWWKITLLVLPVILTSILGLTVFLVQSNIQDSINQDAGHLAARLNLAQDFYKQRLEVYMDLYTKIIDIELFFKDAGTDAADMNTLLSFLDDHTEELSKFSSSKKLFISKQLHETVHDLWLSTIVTTWEERQLDSITDFKDKIETQMRADLIIDELSDYLSDWQRKRALSN